MISKGIISNKSFSCFGGLSFHTVKKVLSFTEVMKAAAFFLLMGQAMPRLLEGQ